MVIDEEIPLLRTFRAELAKRSSMLVDEDMQGFFEQLEEFEGYTSQPGQFYGGSTRSFVSQVTMHAQTNPTEKMAPPLGSIRVTHMATELMQPQTAKVSPTKSATISSDLTSVSMAIPQNVTSMDISEISPTKVIKRMLSPPPSDDTKRLSKKVASITSVSALRQQDDIDGQELPSSQVLVTVKQDNLAPKATTVYVSAILNPKTGRKMNLVEAIKTGLFDPKTGYFMDPSTQRRIQFREACSRGYISADLQNKFRSPCGVHNPHTGRQMTLMEVIQSGMFDPVKATFRDSKTGQHIPVHEALSKGLITEETAKILCGDGFTVTTITESQAMFGQGDLTALDTSISLSEAIEKELYNPVTGRLHDPLSGQELTILEAVEKGYINPSKREIRDPSSGEYISLIEAVSKGLIDPESGIYFDKPTGKRVPLDEAYQKHMLNKPLTLPKALVDGSLTEKGHILHPETDQVIAFSDAIDSGLLDDTVKCIVDPSNNDVLSIEEAIEKGLIDSRGLYIPPGTAPPQPIGKALEQGHIKLVSENVVFAKPCVKDTMASKMITVSEALKSGVITSTGEFIDTRSGRKVLLRAAASQGFVPKEIVEKITKETSMKDTSGRNLSLLKAVHIGMISPITGEVKDLNTGAVMPLHQATVEGLISTDDAQVLLEILSPVLTCTAVTTKLQPGQEEANFRAVSISEAMTQGLLNEKTGTFKDPNTGSTMPLEAAIEKGLLKLSSEWPQPSLVSEQEEEADKWLQEVATKLVPVAPGTSAVIESKLKRKGNEGFSFTTTTISRPVVSESLVSETRHIMVQSVTDPRTKEQLSPQQASQRGLLDIGHGLFIHPATGKQYTIKEAMGKGFISGKEIDKPAGLDSSSAVKDVRSFSITGVIDPKTKQRITVSQAVKDGILDRERGQYIGLDSKKRERKIPISQAVDEGLVIADDVSGDTATVTSLEGLIKETKTYQLKSVKHPVTGTHLPVIEAVREGILDEHNGI